jgi:hypothetical protein
VVERLLEALEVVARGALARTVLFARVALFGVVERRGLALLAGVDLAVAIWEAFSYLGGTLVLVGTTLAPNTCS